MVSLAILLLPFSCLWLPTIYLYVKIIKVLNAIRLKILNIFYGVSRKLRHTAEASLTISTIEKLFIILTQTCKQEYSLAAWLYVP